MYKSGAAACVGVREEAAPNDERQTMNDEREAGRRQTADCTQPRGVTMRLRSASNELQASSRAESNRSATEHHKRRAMKQQSAEATNDVRDGELKRQKGDEEGCCGWTERLAAKRFKQCH